MEPLHREIPQHALPLVFRHGFVLTESIPSDAPFCDWPVRKIGPYFLLRHPDTALYEAHAGDTHVMLLGHAYNPMLEQWDEAEIVSDLAGYAAIEGVFLDILDLIAGRYAIFIWNGAELTVYHDAMAMQALFYAEEGLPPCIASHADIVARLLNRGYREWFPMLLKHPTYLRKPVKYLPGCATPYDGVSQLTPNTRLRLPSRSIERYWPREPHGSWAKEEDATRHLLMDLRSMGTYLERKPLRPVIGVTAGTDSRGVLASCTNLDPVTFTFSERKRASGDEGKDVVFARTAAQRLGLTHHVLTITLPRPEMASVAAVRASFPFASSRVHGGASANIEWLQAAIDWTTPSVQITGYGGEICRGFYQLSSAALTGYQPVDLARRYGPASGEAAIQREFEIFAERTAFTPERLFDYEPSDIFYWEHRMAMWQGTRNGEYDLVAPRIAAYNSRALFMKFLRLPWRLRKNRRSFLDAANILAPELAE